MDWKTLLTAFTGALGGTATALLLIGFFGKAIIEHWFKKDFKRYEAKLDAIASRDETKFNYLHPERAKAAIEIFAMCVEIRATLVRFPSMDTDAMLNPAVYKQEVMKVVEEAIGQLLVLMNYVTPRSVYFEGELHKKLKQFPRHVLKELLEKLKFLNLRQQRVKYRKR